MTKTLRYLILFAMWIFISTDAYSVLVSQIITDSASYQRYPYLRIIESIDSVPMTDEDFFDNAGSVVFPVNKTNLPSESPLLQELSDSVIPLLQRDSLQFVRIVLRGAASPEGPMWNNDKLSKKRVQALLDFLKQKSGIAFSDEVLSVYAETEDYRSLCLMMWRAMDTDYDAVSNLCDKYLPSKNYVQLKKKLKALKGGRVWRRILRTYFPQLRATRFMLLVKKPKKVEPKREVAPVTTDTKFVAVAPDTVLTEEFIARRELLSIKTNLLFYGVYMPFGYNRYCPIPNVAIEYYPLHGHFTFGASIDFPWWINYAKHKFFEVRNFQAEARYYLRSGDIEKNPPGEGAAFKGLYLQGYLHGGVFEIGLHRDRGYKGEGFGGGLGVGYMMPISKKGHWRLEFAAQFGYLYVMHDPFQYEYRGIELHDDLYYYDWVRPASEFKKRQYRYTYFGPTRVGVTLTYDLLYRTNAKTKKKLSFKRVSFRSKEKTVKKVIVNK